MTTRPFALYPCLPLLFLSWGCSATTTAVMGPEGFHHRYHPIFVPHEDPEKRAVLGPEWIATNFRYDDGRPDAMKNDLQYAVRYTFENAHGTSIDVAPMTRNDLVLEHGEHDGLIWLRSQPVSSTDEGKRPDVMLRRWLTRLADRGVEVHADDRLVLIDRGGMIPEPVDVVGCQLAGMPAAIATFSLADRGQALIAPEARALRVSIVMVRTGYRWELERLETPAWLIVGYANQVSDFERGQTDFHRLLGRIQLGAASAELSETGRGYKRGFHCDAQPVAASAVSRASSQAPAAPSASPTREVHDPEPGHVEMDPSTVPPPENP